MLNPHELAVLRSIADTLFPYVEDGPQERERLDAAIQWWRKSLASSRSLDDQQLARVLQLPVPQESLVYMAQRMEECLPPGQWTAIRWVIHLLSTGYGTWLLSTGQYWTPFLRLQPVDRERILLGWSQSSITPVRLLIRVLYKFMCSAFIGKSIGGDGLAGKAVTAVGTATATATTPVGTAASNPLWDSMGYPGPNDPTRPPVKSSSSEDWFRAVSVEEAARKSYDAIVVGSGAGGGVMADRLAEAGFRVLVCEKGNYVRPEDLSLLEEESYATMYERNGCVPSEDGSIVVLAGSTLGGGIWAGAGADSTSSTVMTYNIVSTTTRNRNQLECKPADTVLRARRVGK